MSAAELVPGDVFVMQGVRVTVLANSQPWTDLFGRTLFAYQCRREDTGAEGLVPFGPTGAVEIPEKL